MKKIIIPVVLMLLNMSCRSYEGITYTSADFLKESYEAKNYLKRSFASVPRGAVFKTPADNVDVLDVNWPGDTLIATVEENQPWKNHTHYHFLLDLSDTNLTAYKQTDSTAMTASVLLDYYFSRLSNIGFETASEPDTFLLHPIQFASNTWFKAQSGITITGSIYINIEYKTAMVIADISEIYKRP